MIMESIGTREQKIVSVLRNFGSKVCESIGKNIRILALIAAGCASGEAISSDKNIDDSDTETEMSDDKKKDEEKKKIASLLVEPNSVDFGAPIFGTQVRQKIALVNTGDQRLSINDLTINEDEYPGDGEQEFSTEPFAESIAWTLEPRAKREFDVVYSPTAGYNDDRGSITIRAATDEEKLEEHVAMEARIEGTPGFDLCMHPPSGQAFFTDCVEPEMIFYDAVFGAEYTNSFTLWNLTGNGNRPVTVEEPRLDVLPEYAPFFNIDTYIADTAGTFVEDVTDFPVRLNPAGGGQGPNRLIVDVNFRPGLAGSFPEGAQSVVINVDDGLAETTEEQIVPLEGDVVCPDDPEEAVVFFGRRCTCACTITLPERCSFPDGTECDPTGE